MCLAVVFAGPVLLAPRGALAGNADRAAVVEMVDAAVAAIDRYGVPRAVRKTAPRTWYRSRSGLYIFVLGRDGTLLLHPDEGMEGRNVAATLDAKGKPFIRDIIAETLAAPHEGAWTEYIWLDPRTGTSGTKHTYSRLAAGVVVAAGYISDHG
ncbi:cache domain-containing protein [Solirhodobacter olei]|uniref:cache domain-containing protein n=1 Tax=Solirhodobacter olei TaxID=2493082 RepID=UPI0013E358EE|nr:cache domain-containing protein [Solirhodobacter olei]